MTVKFDSILGSLRESDSNTSSSASSGVDLATVISLVSGISAVNHSELFNTSGRLDNLIVSTSAILYSDLQAVSATNYSVNVTTSSNLYAIIQNSSGSSQSGGNWGFISGNLSAQTDLYSLISGISAVNHSELLVTSGNLYTLIQNSSGGSSVDVSGTTVVEEIYIDSQLLVPRITNGCSDLQTIETATNKVNDIVAWFDPSVKQYAQCKFVLPDSWDKGEIKAKIIWIANTNDAGGIVFGVQGVSLRPEDNLDSNFGTAQEVADTFVSVEKIGITNATNLIVLAGTIEDGNINYLQIFRDVDAGSDTYNGNVGILGIIIQYSKKLSCIPWPTVF